MARLLTYRLTLKLVVKPLNPLTMSGGCHHILFEPGGGGGGGGGGSYFKSNYLPNLACTGRLPQGWLLGPGRLLDYWVLFTYILCGLIYTPLLLCGKVPTLRWYESTNCGYQPTYNPL